MINSEAETVTFELNKLFAVFRYLRVQTSFEKIMETYDHWADIFKKEPFSALTMEQLEQLGEVFFFKTDGIQRCRNEFMYFIKQNQEFYNDELPVVIDRLKNARERYNLAHPNDEAIPFINWIPIYGGKIQHAKTRAQAEYDWHKRYQAPFALDHYVIPLDEKRPRKGARQTDEEDDDE